MANWQFTLDIQNAWNKAKEDKISSIDLAKEIIIQLKRLRPLIEARYSGKMPVVLLDSLILQFNKFVAKDEDDNNSFDTIFNDLYNWADMELDTNWPPKKLCWVKAVC